MFPAYCFYSSIWGIMYEYETIRYDYAGEQGEKACSARTKQFWYR